MQIKRVLMAALLGICCTACQSYYSVVDLHTNQKYYTRGNLWWMEKPHGGIDFHELFTGDYVVLMNARVHALSPDQVKQLTAAPQPPASNP